MSQLEGIKVAILAAHGFEESELTQPLETLREEGAMVDIVSLKSGQICAWNRGEWGGVYEVDQTVSEAIADEYDALVLPGGVMNPDTLRMDEEAISFVKYFVQTGKPIAAICHGPWMLIEAGGVRDREMTSYPSIKSDLINAGANWVDEEVVVDQGIITSRSPGDLPAFCKKMVEEFKEGVHVHRRGYSINGIME